MKGGTVVWITGLPGSGKTTLAAEVERVLRGRSASLVRLDGDVFIGTAGRIALPKPRHRNRSRRLIQPAQDERT